MDQSSPRVRALGAAQCMCSYVAAASSTTGSCSKTRSDGLERGPGLYERLPAVASGLLIGCASVMDIEPHRYRFKYCYFSDPLKTLPTPTEPCMVGGGMLLKKITV